VKNYCGTEKEARALNEVEKPLKKKKKELLYNTLEKRHFRVERHHTPSP
jgi:hypothetical protein